MKSREGEFRLAPRRESFEDEKLDAMIVIPAMNEGDKILDTIYSAVHQIPHKNQKLRHGIVVVINNRPISDEAIKSSNLRTYLLLQALEHKIPISKRGDKAANEKIKFIQEQKIPIHIVDSFSEQYSHPNSNVGRARRIGTEHALSKVHDEGFIVSTDADTMLNSWLMGSAKRMFEAHQDVVGTRIHMAANLIGTDIPEKKASIAAELHWGLQKWIPTEPAYIEDEFVWMAGAGSAFRAKNYKQLAEKGRGYTDIPGHEDTMLGSSLADEGWVIRDMTDQYRNLRASTRQRFSERASTGYGRAMLEFDVTNTKFRDLLVESPDYLKQKDLFFHAVEDIYLKDLVHSYDKEPDEPIDQLFGVFSNRTTGKRFVENFIAETKEHAVEKFSKLCDEFSLSDDKMKLIEIYRRWKPNQEMGLGHHDFIEEAKKVFEKKYPKIKMEDLYGTVRKRMLEENANAVDEPAVKSLLELYPDVPWNLERFEGAVLKEATACGVNLSDEDTVLKVRTVIANSYRKIDTGVGNLIVKKSVEDERKRMEENGSEKASATVKILRALEVPHHLMERRLVYDASWQIASAVAEIRNSLLWDQSREVAHTLEARALALERLASAFYDANLRKETEAFRARSEEVIAAAQTAMDALDKIRVHSVRQS